MSFFARYPAGHADFRLRERAALRAESHRYADLAHGKLGSAPPQPMLTPRRERRTKIWIVTFLVIARSKATKQSSNDLSWLALLAMTIQKRTRQRHGQ
jgi:hypothetical protein